MGKTKLLAALAVAVAAADAYLAFRNYRMKKKITIINAAAWDHDQKARPAQPQGKMRPFEETGRPISSAST